MRLRLVFAVIGVLVLAGLGLIRHERATAEQFRVALLQAEAAEGAAAADRPGAIGSSRAAAPAAPGAAPVAELRAPGSSVTAAPPTAAGVPRQPGTATPSVTVQVAPPPLYGQAGGMNPYLGGLFPQGAADDPELNELTGQDQQIEQQAQSLQRQLADTDDDKQRADIKAKLASTLEKQFDAQQKLRELEVTRIEARVKKLRELIQKRTESRRKIIENRLEQLTNDAEGLGWSSADKGGVQYAPRALGTPGYSNRFAVPTRPLPAPQPGPQPRVE